MTTDTEDLLWRRFNEWFRARRPDYPSEWDAYQAGHADAKAETADAVAAEREKCAQVCDRLSVNQPWDYDASTRASAARDCAAAIRAGTKEPSDADQA